MNDADVVRAKADLDKALSGRAPNNAVLFGEELFKEFRDRQWFTLETFGLLGTNLFAEKVPAYAKTHYAFMTWDVPPTEFRVQ